MDFWNFSRIEKRICNAGVGCPYVDAENEFAYRTVVRAKRGHVRVGSLCKEERRWTWKSLKVRYLSIEHDAAAAAATKV